MKIFTAAVAAIAAIAFFSGCNKPAVEETAPVTLVTTADTISYLIGNDIGNSLKSVNDEVVLEVVFAGIRDRLAGKDPRFPPNQERIIMEAFSMKMQEKKMSERRGQAKKNLEESEKFLAENGKKDGVVTTESGLQYIVIKKGDGPVPNDSSRVSVHYEGTLLNGKVFDSSIKRGTPAVFNVSQVVKGWTEALKLMNTGSKFKIFVPPQLGYGERGMAHDIEPNMMLIFEIELLEIVK